MNHVATHPFTSEELMTFLDGELSNEEAQAVEAHLIACPECADQVQQFRETSQSLREWSAPPIPKRIGEAVEEQLQPADSARQRRVKAPRSVGTRKPRWRPWAIAGGSVVTVFMLLVAVGISVSHYRASQLASAKKSYDVTNVEPDSKPESQAAAYFDTEDRSRPGNAGGASQAVNNRLTDQVQSSPPSSPTPPPTVSNAPMIARSASFLIVAKDIPATRSSLDAILQRNHGYAADMTVSTPADDAPSLKASLRIPVANLAETMKELRGLGRVANESESGEDVTQQHADLDQRLKTARDTEERFRAILQQRTGSLNDVLQVEEEIARVRGDIESMEAEQTNLEHRVNFAGVDLSVTVESSPVSGSTPLTARLHDAFVTGYRTAAGTVIGIFLFVVAYGPTILIWIAILAVPVYLLRRRYRRMHAKL